MPMDAYNIGAVAASLGLLAAYHLFLYTCVHLETPHLQLTINLREASKWISKHKESDEAPAVTLAVQTLRNTIFVAIFLGGAVFRYGFTASSSYTAAESMQEKAREAVLATCLFGSFLCWACVIRFAAHLGFLIGTLAFENSDEYLMTMQAAPPDATEAHHVLTREEDCRKLIRLLMVFFSLGFRFMFIALRMLCHGGRGAACFHSCDDGVLGVL